LDWGEGEFDVVRVVPVDGEDPGSDWAVTLRNRGCARAVGRPATCPGDVARLTIVC